MKKVVITVFLSMFLFSLTGCDLFEGDRELYRDSGYLLGGDTVYIYRYEKDESCMDTAVHLQDTEMYGHLLFKVDNTYVYGASTAFTQDLGPNDTHICYSNFYIKNNGQYITVYQAYEQDIYSETEFITLAQSMDSGTVFISLLGPTEVTLDDLSTDISELGN